MQGNIGRNWVHNTPALPNLVSANPIEPYGMHYQQAGAVGGPQAQHIYAYMPAPPMQNIANEGNNR